MITPTSASEHLMFSTVRIEAYDTNGSQSVGTGFFFIYKIDEQRQLPVIVTNKHVIKNATKGRLCFHEAERTDDIVKPSGKYFPVDFHDFESRWILHPETDIDLCAMLFNPVGTSVKEQLNKDIYTLYLDETLIQSHHQLEQLSAVEDILMIGYPIGLWDSVNNLPIVRRGITATHPAIDFEGKSITIIDAACFPGSSGSPVLIINEGGYGAKGGFHIGKRMILLGVLFAGPTHNVEGILAIEPIPTRVEAKTIVPTMINLGFIVKANELLVLGEHLKKILNL